jgi:hypothetical protein
MAHCSVGKEARGGTPYKSEASSKRTSEMCSKEERRTEIAGMRADIDQSTNQKEIRTRQKSNKLIIMERKMFDARKLNCLNWPI